MAELKTKPTRKSARKFLKSIENERKRQNAFDILALFEQVTKKKPVMWGESIVGFGSYHYRQKGGQEASWPITGFSPRKQNLTIYIMPGFSNYRDLLAKLGKHKTSKSCLYINKLDDIDKNILKKLIANSVRDMKRTYACK